MDRPEETPEERRKREDGYQRETALQLAVEIHKTGMVEKTETVLDTAEKFLAFIRGA